MSPPAAKLGDRVVAVDLHTVMLPSPAGPVPTPFSLPFQGKLIDGLSTSTYVDGKPAATKGSGALNSPVHLPPGGPFQQPPSNRATIEGGSRSVFIDSQAAARNLDQATTCNDPQDIQAGVVIAGGTVFVGG